jgi:hypothetical protein
VKIMEPIQARPIDDLQKLRVAVLALDESLRNFVNTVAPLSCELGLVADTLPIHWTNRLQIARMVAYVRNMGKNL